MIQDRVKNPIGPEIIDQQWYESGVTFIALLTNSCASVEEEGSGGDQGWVLPDRWYRRTVCEEFRTCARER